MRTLVLLENDLNSRLSPTLNSAPNWQSNFAFEAENVNSSDDFLDLAFDKLAGTYQRLVIVCTDANRQRLLHHIAGVESSTWGIIEKIALIELLHLGLEAKPFQYVALGQMLLTKTLDLSLEDLIFEIENGARHSPETPASTSGRATTQDLMDNLMSLVDSKLPIDSHLAALQLNQDHEAVVQAIKKLGEQGLLEVAEYQGGMWMIWSKRVS
jgi:hypothetical protein